MLRVVADTNTIISGLLWRGKPNELLREATHGEVIFCSSPALQAELADVLCRPKFAARWQQLRIDPSETFSKFRDAAQVFRPRSLPRSIVAEDPDDDAVLSCALAAKPDLIVSGDHHLLRLREFEGIPIVTASELLARLNKK